MRYSIIFLLFILLTAKASGQSRDSTRNKASFGVYLLKGRSQPMRLTHFGTELLRSVTAPYHEFGITWQRPIGQRFGIEANAGIGILQYSNRAEYTLKGLVPGDTLDTHFLSDRELAYILPSITLMGRYALSDSENPWYLKVGLSFIYYYEFQFGVSHSKFVSESDPDRLLYRFTLLQPYSHWAASPQIELEKPIKLWGRHVSLGLSVRYTARPVAFGTYQLFDAPFPTFGTANLRNSFAAIKLKWLFRRDGKNN